MNCNHYPISSSQQNKKIVSQSDIYTHCLESNSPYAHWLLYFSISFWVIRICRTFGPNQYCVLKHFHKYESIQRLNSFQRLSIKTRTHAQWAFNYVGAVIDCSVTKIFFVTHKYCLYSHSFWVIFHFFYSKLTTRRAKYPNLHQQSIYGFHLSSSSKWNTTQCCSVHKSKGIIPSNFEL